MIPLLHRDVIQGHKRRGILQDKVVFLNCSVWAGHLNPVYWMIVTSLPNSTLVNFDAGKISGPFDPDVRFLDVIICVACFREQNEKLSVIYLPAKLLWYCDLTFKSWQHELQISKVVAPSQSISKIVVFSFVQYRCFNSGNLSKIDKEQQLWNHETVQWKLLRLYRSTGSFLLLSQKANRSAILTLILIANLKHWSFGNWGISPGVYHPDIHQFWRPPTFLCKITVLVSAVIKWNWEGDWPTAVCHCPYCYTHIT